MVSVSERIVLDKFRNLIELKYVPQFEIAESLLFSFLRAGSMDIDKSLGLFEKLIEVQDILIGTREILDVNQHKSLKQISDNIVYKFVGYDCQGNLVLWLPAGRWDFRRHLENGLRKELTLHCFRCIHEVLQRVFDEGEKAGRHISVTVILDFEKLSFKKITHLESIRIGHTFLKDIQVLSKVTTKLYMVNAHRVSLYLLTMVKPFISTKMTKKLVLMSSDKEEWKKVLLEKIPLDVLPVEYGGNGEQVVPRVIA